MLFKGFKKIRYVRVNGIDFEGEINGSKYVIEVTYIRGPDFKTQELAKEINGQPIYLLGSKKLINRLKSKYDDKEEQILKHGYDAHNSIVLLISDLEETYLPWLDYVIHEKRHPIDFFVVNAKIPTVLVGCATVYEPEQGIFDKLRPFNFEKYHDQIIEQNFD